MFHLVKGSAYFLLRVHQSCDHVYIYCAYLWYIYIYIYDDVCFLHLPLHVLFLFSLYTHVSLLYAIFYFCFTLRCLDEFCLKYFGNTWWCMYVFFKVSLIYIYIWCMFSSPTFTCVVSFLSLYTYFFTVCNLLFLFHTKMPWWVLFKVFWKYRLSKSTCHKLSSYKIFQEFLLG